MRRARGGMTRRRFGLLAGGWLPAARPAVQGPDLSTIPNFCAHEHWGSIDSIGPVPGGFRADVEAGACPRGRTGLLDLLFEPYLRDMISATGARIQLADLKKRPAWQALTAMRQELAEQQWTGTYQGTRRGLLRLYGVDLLRLDAAACSRLDDAIARNYQDHLGWYRAVMRKAHFSELIRPVHLEFYVRQESPERAAREAAFTRTVWRIDPLLELWRRKSPRRDLYAGITGVEPRDAGSWRAFIERCFDIAASHGAAGIKQLQAYRRDLDFAPRTDADIVWVGDLSEAQVKAFQDWVMHECAKQAHERDWPHQVHVGTHNLTHSSPMPLAALARRYRRMKIVMIHCWPFLREAGWLAKHEANIYIDTCAQTLLGSEVLRQAMQFWLGYVPASKITCGQDATTVEMAVGSSLFTREILSECLGDLNRGVRVEESRLLSLAVDLLHNNAVRVYGLGKLAIGCSPQDRSPTLLTSAVTVSRFFSRGV